MKEKKKPFVQHLFHEIGNDSKVKKYLKESLPLVGRIVMYFNGLEKYLDSILCEFFSHRSDSVGLIVLHNMSYSTKVDLFKRFSDDFHCGVETKIEGYDDLIRNLKESGRLRNIVVHADYESTDEDGYTYVNLRINQGKMHQEYMQLSKESLEHLIILIWKTYGELCGYYEKRQEVLAN